MAVIIPKDLASVIQAEVDRVAPSAPVDTKLHLTQIISAKDDFRYPFDDLVKVADELTSKAVDRMRKKKLPKIKSAALRPLTTII